MVSSGGWGFIWCGLHDVCPLRTLQVSLRLDTSVAGSFRAMKPCEWGSAVSLPVVLLFFIGRAQGPTEWKLREWPEGRLKGKPCCRRLSVDFHRWVNALCDCNSCRCQGRCLSIAQVLAQEHTMLLRLNHLFVRVASQAKGSTRSLLGAMQ